MLGVWPDAYRVRSSWAGQRSCLALQGGLRRAECGEPAVFLIGGEAGVGKSRLVAELAARGRDAGARVLTGHCVALGEGAVPLLPVTEALLQLAEADDDA